MKRVGLLSLSLLAVSTVSAQSVKPRPLGAVQFTSKELLGGATLARALPNGGVIVNDVVRRRLLLLYPVLASYTVIADSTSGSVNGYGQRPGALIPYVADSTLYLDATAGSFLVIDPSGKVTRVMSPPRPNDINFIASQTLRRPTRSHCCVSISILAARTPSRSSARQKPSPRPSHCRMARR
jgi:hypothetical protein